MLLSPPKPRYQDDFKIAIICALPLEAELVDAIFDIYWAKEDIILRRASGDQNAYTLGAIGSHNVVLAHMPGIGGNAAASVSVGIRTTFPQVEVAFVVGICGVSPIHPETGDEIILGDCILSTTVIQYDFGRQHSDFFSRKTEAKDVLGRATPAIRSLVNQLQISRNLDDLSERLADHLEALQNKSSMLKRKAQYPGASNDRLFEVSCLRSHHEEIAIREGCSDATRLHSENCKALGCKKPIKRKRLTDSAVQSGANKPKVHFGQYGSANTVLRSAGERERLTNEDKIVAFEMEGAGVWDNLPTVIVKSACDYADSHKNKDWQPYAAATAAAALKAVLDYWSITDSIKPSRQIAINIPDYAVAHFVPRPDIQKELHNWLLNDTQERLVLRGMGGAGKSQLALACCREAEKSGHFTTVLWMDASSVLSIKQSLKVAILELDESQAVSPDAKENLAAVIRVIRQRQGSWLMIFDNFDVPGAFHKNPITYYIPKAPNGKVLFTSRDAGSERLGHTIRVSGMSESESLDLLLKRPAHDLQERAEGLQIAAELGHLALALDQAEAYIRARNLPLTEFITHFRRRKKIILQEVPQHWEYRRATKPEAEQEKLLSAFTTWDLSFEQISGSPETRQSKEHFLTLCAFFESTSISKGYFKSYCEGSKRPWTSIFKDELMWDSFLFDDLVAECSRLSLFQNEADDSGRSLLTLHPLIRDWLKLRKSHQEQQEFAQEFTDLLVVYSAEVDPEALELAARQKLLYNVALCIQQDERFLLFSAQSKDYPCYPARIFASLYRSSGLYKNAEKLLKHALAAGEECLGHEHFETLQIKHDLVKLYRNQGRYDHAEQLCKQVLIVKETQLGPEHLETLATKHTLAKIYRYKQRYADSEQLLKEVLYGRERHFVSDHLEVLQAKQGLAKVYYSMGKYHEAEELYMQVLAGREEQLGHEHLHTLSVVYYIAKVYRDQHNNQAAKQLFMQVRKGREAKLGPKHPDTLNAIEGLAMIYDLEQKFDETEELHKEVLAGRQERLGIQHPDTLRTMRNLESLLARARSQPLQTVSTYSGLLSPPLYEDKIEQEQH